MALLDILMFAAKTEGTVSAFSRTVNSIQQTVAVVGIAVMPVAVKTPTIGRIPH
jgi:hypothetical protein